MNCPRPAKLSSLAPLVADSPISLYWMGFLMADGHFDSKRNNLAVTLGCKDTEFLQVLADMLECKLNVYARLPNNIVQLSVADTTNFPLIVQKWELESNKTKFPPTKLPLLSEAQFYSWVIGFIDGDGSIDKTGCSGSIVTGVEWGHILTEISLRLSCLNLQERGPSQFSKNNSLRLKLTVAALRKLKLHGEDHHLPVLRRKWDRVSYRISNTMGAFTGL